MVTFRDTWEWDVAAGSILVREAGGAVTDGAGDSLWFNGAVPKTNGVMAAAGALHGALLKRRLGH
jgi:myo-inositol-1(or 4)-monophosphatase